MFDKRFVLRAASYLLLIKKDKILLLRRFNTGWEDGKYTLISGHLEGNETVKQAMIREAKEEAGMVAEKWQGKPQIIEHDKCDDMQWFPLKNLPRNTLPHIRQAVENYFRKVPFSELGFR